MISLLRKLTVLVVLAAVVGAIVYAFLPKPVDVDLALIERGPLVVTVDEDGKTRIRDRYVVSAPLAGRLLRIEMDAGDAVERGNTLLATIEPNDPDLLDARALAEAETRVKAAEVSLAKAGPVLEAARAALEFAESDLGRTQRLFDKNTVPQEELDLAKLAYRTKAEEFRAAEYAEQIAQFELELAKAALLRSRPADDGAEDPWHVEIHAPVSGSVLRVFQESAAVVTAGMPLLEIGDPTDLEAEIDVLSSDAVRIEPGARVMLEQWGGGDPLTGRVRLVEPSAFTKISALGVEEQRVNVIVDLVNPPADRRTLGDAYRVEARIVVWESEDVLKVPTSALFRRGGAWSTFVATDGRAAVRAVEVGHRNGLEAEVLSGLEAGEHVVVHPSDQVEDGVKLAPRAAEGN